jgi:predicted Zn finger-like uncharacterized protein
VIIACPSCQTRFNVDSAKLQPAGRNVRCAKCGHRWHQMPDDGSEALTLSEVAEPPAVTAPAESSEAAEDHPPSPPETPAEMAESLAAIAEQVAGARTGDGYTVTESKSQAVQPNPIQRVVQRTGAIPPGPFTVPPRMRPMRPAKRRSHLGLILLAGFIIGLLVAGYVFRETIARTVPGADLLYSLFSMSTADPAADVEISIDNTLAQPGEDGAQIFQVRATLFNASDYPVNLPPLMVTPVDKAGATMEPILFRVPERVIEPGQNIKFQKSFDNWPRTATSFLLTFATQP